MSLPASQHQVLAAIDDELAAADPALAADFADFGGGLCCPQGAWPLPPPSRGLRRGGRWWQLSVSRRRAGRPPGGRAS